MLDCRLRKSKLSSVWSSELVLGIILGLGTGLGSFKDRIQNETKQISKNKQPLVDKKY